MLGHLSFGVRDLATSKVFYDAVLSALGYVTVFEGDHAVGYGSPGSPDDRLLLIGKHDDAAPPGPGFHLAFAAPSRKAVDRFHAAALTTGGLDQGRPGPRPHYGPGYYAAFVLDPDGHKLEAKFPPPDDKQPSRVPVEIERPVDQAKAPRLIVLAGLPGVGKSSIARELSRRTGAVWLRIDTIEQAIRESESGTGDVGDLGYRAAYALARDHLALQHDVVADSVNPWMLTRDAWQAVGSTSRAVTLEIEVACSDRTEHRRRIETRTAEIAGLTLPDWQDVIERDYQPWSRACRALDTAGRSVEDCVDSVLAMMPAIHAEDATSGKTPKFSDVEIRAVTPGDIEGFHRALDIVAREREYLTLTEAPPFEDTRSYVLQAMARGDIRFVALIDNAVVGWCDISRLSFPSHAHRGRLGMGLLPGFRGAGLGQSLINATIDAAWQAGFTRIELDVHADNGRAIALYEKVGFVREGRTRDAARIDGRYRDAITMALIDRRHAVHDHGAAGSPEQ